MNLNIRIFLTFSLVLSLAIMVAMNQFLTEIKPGVRQSAEHTLVDTAQLLAEIIADQINFTELEQDQFSNFSRSVQRFLQRQYAIDIYNIEKSHSELRIYMTNQKGIVIYDSREEALGQDYSQWNDVYLTLRGQYGARTTQEDPSNPMATTMYVAAPIIQNQAIQGVLTIGKPNILSQPFIDLAQSKLRKNTVILGLIFIVLGAFVSIWLTRSIRQLAHYAHLIALGKRAVLPTLKEKELQALGQAMESMRKEVEGKAYIEKYIHALTHELKSPVTAIQASAEIISPEMPHQDKIKFLDNIQTEVKRIDELISRLLSLASLEKQNTLLSKNLCQLDALIKDRVNSKSGFILKQGLIMSLELESETTIDADELLIGQAIDNLLLNAIEFSSHGAEIKICLKQNSNSAHLSIQDQGPGIPEYAKHRVFERFYSLPRPDSGKKSTGLGLCFVKQVIDLHEGSIELNHPKKGLIVDIKLPLHKN